MKGKSPGIITAVCPDEALNRPQQGEIHSKPPKHHVHTVTQSDFSQTLWAGNCPLCLKVIIKIR